MDLLWPCAKNRCQRLPWSLVFVPWLNGSKNRRVSKFAGIHPSLALLQRFVCVVYVHAHTRELSVFVRWRWSSPPTSCPLRLSTHMYALHKLTTFFLSLKKHTHTHTLNMQHISPIEKSGCTTPYSAVMTHCQELCCTATVLPLVLSKICMWGFFVLLFFFLFSNTTGKHPHLI